MTPLTPEQREAARKLAESVCNRPRPLGTAYTEDLSRALLDAEAEVAAMKAALAKAPHSAGCILACSDRCLCWKSGPALSDSIARGRELLEKEAELAKLKGESNA